MCYINSVSYDYLINEIFTKYKINYCIEKARFADASKLYVCSSDKLKIRPVANSFNDIHSPIPQIYIKDLFNKLSNYQDYKHLPFNDIFNKINWTAYK
ncbi:MAG TPA: hypothetical protein PKY81_10435 [bacterium]|nr:hypothetical protein [bacterium]HPN31364.1 hypothetical protein [bacterium]